jgi:hypothetical protein
LDRLGRRSAHTRRTFERNTQARLAAHLIASCVIGALTRTARSIDARFPVAAEIAAQLSRSSITIAVPATRLRANIRTETLLDRIHSRLVIARARSLQTDDSYNNRNNNSHILHCKSALQTNPAHHLI